MCSRAAAWRDRAAATDGQSTSEYVLLTGMVVAVAVILANGLGVSLRLAMQTAAQRVLGVVIGYP